MLILHSVHGYYLRGVMTGSPYKILVRESVPCSLMPNGNSLSSGGLGGVALVVVGGLMSLSAVSNGAVKLLQVASEAKQRNAGGKCLVCRGVGFYICKLCRGNSTILNWSPLYDPISFNPCVCPTCDAHKVQKCLNCVGKGYT